jgi:Bacteriocin-protection, YdeI or OmpD-Associated/Domain of unknown function (DUF1905)
MNALLSQAAMRATLSQVMETKSKKFKAEVWSPHPSGAWKAITLPFSVEKEWGTKARLAVKVKIGSQEFQTSVMPTGEGTHVMMFNKQMQTASGIHQLGQSVEMEMAPDTSKRVVEVPADLKKALSAQSKAKSFFESLTPAQKKAYVDWISDSKREESRQQRIEKTVQMLSEGKKYE